MLIDTCIPFCPTDVSGIIDVCNPLIKQLPFCSSDEFQMPRSSDVILSLTLTGITDPFRPLKVNLL